MRLPRATFVLLSAFGLSIASPAFADESVSGATPPPSSAAPAADSAAPATKKKGEPTPLPWRDTTFTFNTAATTTALGVGRNNIDTGGDYAGLEWDLSPRFHFLDPIKLPNDDLYVAATAGVAVEVTNGDTTKKNQPTFIDTGLSVGYSRVLIKSKDKEWSAKAGLTAGLTFPTSRTSANQGKYVTTSLGANVGGNIRLLGRDADGLNSLSITGTLSWSHLFSRSFTATNGGLQRTRQNAGGDSFESDQLSFYSFDTNRLTPGIRFGLPLYKDLSLSTSMRLVGRFKHKFEGSPCEAQTLTGCVKADQSANPITYTTNSAFDVSLSQSIYDVVDLTIGYSNETLTLGEDGKTRNVFYSPDAQFYLDLTANIDVIYSKASGREKKQTASNTSPPSF